MRKKKRGCWSCLRVRTLFLGTESAFLVAGGHDLVLPNQHASLLPNEHASIVFLALCQSVKLYIFVFRINFRTPGTKFRAASVGVLLLFFPCQPAKILPLLPFCIPDEGFGKTLLKSCMPVGLRKVVGKKFREP